MDKDTQGLMFSSKSNEWATPQDFYNKLNAEFGFTLDPCAHPQQQNAPPIIQRMTMGYQRTGQATQYL